MEVYLNLGEGKTEFLQNIINLEASMRGSSDDGKLQELILEIFERGMEDKYEEQLDAFEEYRQKSLDEAFESITATPDGVSWLTSFGLEMEILTC